MVTVERKNSQCVLVETVLSRKFMARKACVTKAELSLVGDVMMHPKSLEE